MSSASTGGTEGSSPASSPASAASLAMAAPKFGTLVPNRIFVGGISASTSEAELAQLFSAYGNVKATKIISDRAGVSKGYGFVTFETDEEARRLQQESECIILRERKLNIAPAIKKQPFNRSFDGGSGSPPAVPTSTYYYTNGMGLTYQNGLTFYNAGAPAPGTPIAPPTDPATIYQAAGVFAPQATSGHQTFAPVMYSCPAPSLYMPQQYQYSPMPYESYYAGVAAGGGPPQYALYASSAGNQQQQQQQQQSQQGQSNGSVVGSGGGGGNNVAGSGINGTGASSPPALGSLPPPNTQFYAPSAPPGPPTHHHHHPPLAAAPPPQPQLDHLYYSFAAPGPPPVPPQPQHQTIGIGDQPLLLYTTDPNSCQQLNATADSQANAQEDTRSSSSHSDQPKHQQSETPQQQQQQQQQQAHQTQSQLSTTPLMSLMPLKYPIMSARYANYHPLAMHPGSLQQQQQQQQQQSHHALTQHQIQSTANGGSGHNSLNSERSEIEESGSPSPMHRSQSATTYLYPATVYIPHGASYPTTAGPTVGTSLLPTPGTAYESPLKLHQSAGKPGVGINSSLGINLGYHRTPNSYSILGGVQQQSYPKNQGYSRKYGNYQGTVNTGERGRYYGNKSGLASQQYSYVTPRPGIFASQILTNFAGNPTAAYNGQSYTHPRRNLGDQWTESYDSSRYGNSRRRDSSSSHIRSAKNLGNRDNHETAQTAGKTSGSNADIVADESRVADDSTDKSLGISGIAVTDRNNKSPIINNNNNCSPPPAPYSPMTRPIPNISPPVSQVQFYATGAQAQTRYHQPQISHHQSQQQQQQQQSGQRRYAGFGQSVNPGRKPTGSQVGSGEILRRPKNKVNGALMQSGSAGKLQDDNCLGGGGDATGSNIANRMPITPPATPRNNAVGNASNSGSVGNDPNQISDACHQMQALSL